MNPRNGTRARPRQRGAAHFLAIVILKLATIPIVAVSVALSVYIRTSPYAPTEALMHLVARAGCPAAASVGLAQSRRGDLGYHTGNDPDGDGIACGTTTPIVYVPPSVETTNDRTRGGAKFIRPEPAGG